MSLLIETKVDDMRVQLSCIAMFNPIELGWKVKTVKYFYVEAGLRGDIAVQAEAESLENAIRFLADKCAPALKRLHEIEQSLRLDKKDY